MRQKPLVLLCILSLCLGATALSAQPASFSSEFRASSAAVPRSLNPAASHSAQGFVIVWEQRQRGLYGRVFDSGVGPRGTELRLVANDPVPALPFHGVVRTRKDPAVAAFGPGAFLLLWTEETSDLSADIFFEDRTLLDRDVFVQRFDRDGTPAGPRVRIDGAAAGLQSLPAAAVLPGSRVLVTWQSTESGSPEGDGIFARVLDNMGHPVSDVFKVDDDPGSAGTRPAVAAAVSGAALIAWDGCCDSSGDSGVFARLVDADGLPQGLPFEVATTTARSQIRPAVAASPDGTFLVVWQHYQVSRESGKTHRILGRWLDADGEPLGAQLQVSTGRGWAHTSPAVVARPGGGFMVAWLVWQGSFRMGVDGIDLNRSGARQGGVYRVSQGPIGAQNRFALSAGRNGEIIAAWEDFATDGVLGIAGRRRN